MGDSINDKNRWIQALLLYNSVQVGVHGGEGGVVLIASKLHAKQLVMEQSRAFHMMEALPLMNVSIVFHNQGSILSL